LKLDRNCQVNSAMMPSKWVARFHLREWGDDVKESLNQRNLVNQRS
jgi:hypothetical protein